MLEPPCFLLSDGKRPDWLTLMPWQSGRPIVWDATFTDTSAVFYRGQANTAAGCVAAYAEEKKCEKCSHLVPNYQPVVIETSWVIGELSGSRIWQGKFYCLPPPETLNSSVVREGSSHPGSH